MIWELENSLGLLEKHKLVCVHTHTFHLISGNHHIWDECLESRGNMFVERPPC